MRSNVLSERGMIVGNLAQDLDYWPSWDQCERIAQKLGNGFDDRAKVLRELKALGLKKGEKPK